jgi:hypothetical protein
MKTWYTVVLSMIAYSITSSPMTSSPGEKLRPNALSPTCLFLVYPSPLVEEADAAAKSLF